MPLNNAPIKDGVWGSAWVNWFSNITRMIQTGTLYPTRSVIASVTAVLNDSIILADATAGAVTITLPAAATTQDKRFVIKKTDSSGNAVNVTPTSGLIDGAASFAITLAQGAVDVVSDGANYWLV